MWAGFTIVAGGGGCKVPPIWIEKVRGESHRFGASDVADEALPPKPQHAAGIFLWLLLTDAPV